MRNARFDAVYELARQKEQQNLKEEYERLNKESKMFNNFEEYLSKLKESQNIKSYKEIEDNYINKEIIEKEEFTIEIYLIQFPFYSSLMLDENYNNLPLEKKELYECGLNIKTNGYCIKNLLTNVSEDKEVIEDNFKKLTDIVNNNNIEEILNLIEKELKK